MNKIAFFTLLVLIYLAIFSNITPEKNSGQKIETSKDLTSISLKHYDDIKNDINEDTNIHYTIVLEGYDKRGYILKRYYHRYRMISPYFSPQVIEKEVSRTMYKNYRKYLGLSIAHIGDQSNFTPLPPGFLFTQNIRMGRWITKKTKKQWRFYRAYRDLPILLRWESYRPLFKSYSKQESNNFSRSFWGKSKTFSRSGSIGKRNYQELEKNSRITNLKLRTKIKRYFSKVFDLW